MGSRQDTLLQLPASAFLSTQPTEDTCSLTLHPFLGSKTPQSRIYPTHGNWKVMVRAGRAMPRAGLALPGLLQPCRGAQLQRGSAEQDPGPGASEELPCLPAQRAGLADREGPQQTLRSSRGRDKRRFLPGNPYKVLGTQRLCWVNRHYHRTRCQPFAPQTGTAITSLEIPELIRTKHFTQIPLQRRDLTEEGTCDRNRLGGFV